MSSSSAIYLRKVNDAICNRDKTAAQDAFYDYHKNHCLNPRYIKILDQHTSKYRHIQIGCGHCFYCTQTKVNSWCTRMYAHAEDFKNVYFVTLTYRSITNPNLPVNKLLLDKLSQAVWHYDNFNSTHHLCYSPCLLQKSHYQNFLKRLRKNTGINDLSFVLSGEYGSKYGRPHFHMVLFTNSTLSAADIRRAWSVCLWKSNEGKWSYRTSQTRNGVAYDFPIGNVDFHDLVSNGTFNTAGKVKVDGTFMNAANCFQYVCKYVVKRDKANLIRIRIAYRDLFNKYKYVKIFDKEVLFENAIETLLLLGYSPEKADEIIQNNLKFKTYEKIIFEPCEGIFKHGLCCEKPFEIGGCQFSRELLPKHYQDFIDSFVPFCEFSRGCPIGCIYATRHISEFAQDVFNKPLLQDTGFVVPDYFRHKAQKYLYRLRRERTTISGKSMVLSSLPDISRLFQSPDGSNLSYMLCDDIGYDFQKIKQYIQSDFHHFCDAYTGERIVLYNNHAQYYKYDRKSRSYQFTRAVSLPEWIRVNALNLQLEFDRAAAKLRMSNENFRERDAADTLMNEFGDRNALLDSFSQRVAALRAQTQKQYEAQHNSVE